jgi:hypothetical protein
MAMSLKNITLYLTAALFIAFGACTQESTMRHSQDSTIQSRADDDDDALDDAQEEESEIEIEVASLPQSIKDGIASRYAGAQLKEADKITQTDGSTTYDVEIVVNGEVIEVMYAADGGYLGEEEDD